MTEGINSGRVCPWSKEYLLFLYNRINLYCRVATLNALKSEGEQAAMDTMVAYSMFKYPVAYIFIHYHFGKCEDLEMEEADISGYIGVFLSQVKFFVQELLKSLKDNQLFEYDSQDIIGPALLDICREILYIEDNF